MRSWRGRSRVSLLRRFSTSLCLVLFFFFQAEDGIRDKLVTGVQTCALPISHAFVLGVQLVPALVFLSVLISHAELRILAERFAPLYETEIGRASCRERV